MPRKYTRKTERGSWSAEGMALAVQKVMNNQMGFLKAAKTKKAAAARETPRTHLSRRTSSGSSSFQFSPEDIRSLPKESEKRKKRINKNRGATAILTSSPYKAKLQDAETSKKMAKPSGKKTHQKKEQSKEKGVAADKKRRRPGGKKNKKRTVQQDFSSDDDENGSGDACMYCDQLLCETPLSESWSMCTVCKEFAHDKCSGFDSDEDESFFCDFCKDLIPQVNLK